MEQWERSHPELLQREWYCTHKQNILKGGLSRYISTCSDVPHPLDSVPRIMRCISEKVREELRHIYLQGFDGPRNKPSKRLSSLRDRFTKLMNPPSANSTEFQEINEMFSSAPTKKWIDYLQNHILIHFTPISSGGQHQGHQFCVDPRKRKALAAVGIDTFLPNESEMQSFFRSFRSIHNRMPLEIGKSDDVVSIDFENEKVLYINQIPLHEDTERAQNLAKNSKRGLVGFNSLEFFSLDYQSEVARFLLQRSRANFSDFRSKSVHVDMENKIEQRPIWTVNLLHKGEKEGGENKTMRGMAKNTYSSLPFSQQSWEQDEKSWMQVATVPFYSMTRLHTTVEHLDAFATTSSQEDRDFIKELVRRCNDVYTRAADALCKFDPDMSDVSGDLSMKSASILVSSDIPADIGLKIMSGNGPSTYCFDGNGGPKGWGGELKGYLPSSDGSEPGGGGPGGGSGDVGPRNAAASPAAADPAAAPAMSDPGPGNLLQASPSTPPLLHSGSTLKFVVFLSLTHTHTHITPSWRRGCLHSRRRRAWRARRRRARRRRARRRRWTWY